MPVSINRPGPWTHRDISAGGTRFHAALAGPQAPLGGEDAGTLVVLLHGFPECWWAWREVIPALAGAGHRVAALDLRGFGGSDRPPSGYDLVTLADDVSGAVRALGHERALVVGAGIGGAVAWTMAGRHGRLLRGIVPVGAPHPLAVRSLRGRAFSGAALQYLGLKTPKLPERSLSTPAGMERLLRSWYAPHHAGIATSAAGYYAALMARPGAARSGLETVRHILLTRTERSALAAPVPLPVLSVQGEIDPVQPAQAYARDTHQVAGRLQQVTIRGAGHFPHEETPERFTAAVVPFLADLA